MGIQTNGSVNLWVQYMQQMTQQVMRATARDLSLCSCAYSRQQMSAWQQPSQLVANLQAANHAHVDCLV